ncbi:acyltransferase family protein [Bacillus toyonensis]|uniref:acyltransferase family protein n=1 Tax=Bacillus toyonensis TaxID=155322 RepID=UPI000BF56B8C|nr:acyltransferase family protein [Bacillus toyonensis]PEU35504.1 hypothetical protein CN537_25105 [Bacillus toyonensis]
MKQKREIWIDIAKGLGVIGVVLGHSGNEIAHHYLFWFHMPLFFVLSGYTFKALNEREEFLPWLKRRAKQLLIPYLSFSIIITLLKSGIEVYQGNFNIMSILDNGFRIIYGGQLLTGLFGVFWFITCLFLTQVVFALILIKFKKVKHQLIIIGIAYLLAHIEAKLLDIHNVPVPWNADVVLIAIVYYAFGFYYRDFIANTIKRKLSAIILLSISCLFIIGEYSGFFTYSLDLKIHLYNNLILDLIIPISFTLTVCVISYWISKLSIFKMFSTLGMMSLPIMYLHIPLNVLALYISFDYGIFTYALIGITIPVLMNMFFLDRFKITRFLFLGNSVKNKPSHNQLNKEAV